MDELTSGERFETEITVDALNNPALQRVLLPFSVRFTEVQVRDAEIAAITAEGPELTPYFKGLYTLLISHSNLQVLRFDFPIPISVVIDSKGELIQTTELTVLDYPSLIQVILKVFRRVFFAPHTADKLLGSHPEFATLCKSQMNGIDHDAFLKQFEKCAEYNEEWAIPSAIREDHDKHERGWTHLNRDALMSESDFDGMADWLFSLISADIPESISSLLVAFAFGTRQQCCGLAHFFVGHWISQAPVHPSFSPSMITVHQRSIKMQTTKDQSLGTLALRSEYYTLKMLSGWLIRVWAEPSYTIGELKELLCIQYGFPLQRIFLIANGTRFDGEHDSDTLKHHCLFPSSLIHLVYLDVGKEKVI